MGKTVYTYHGLERMKERVGVKNLKEAEHLASIVMERGDTFEDCRFKIDQEYLKNRTKNTQKAFAYNGFCYIINVKKGVIITVYQLPKSFGKKKANYFEKAGQKYSRVNYKAESLRICCEANDEIIEF